MNTCNEIVIIVLFVWLFFTYIHGRNDVISIHICKKEEKKGREIIEYVTCGKFYMSLFIVSIIMKNLRKFKGLITLIPVNY